MILVTGHTGVIGSAVKRFLGTEHEIMGLSSKPIANDIERCDIRDFDTLRDIFLRYRPEAVVHLAGVKNLRLCETDPDYCHTVNVLGTKNVSILSDLVGAWLIYVSSDYVFDGENGRYREGHRRHPQQEYGRSKVDAENIVESVGGMICRTAGVYGLDSPRPTFLEFVLENLTKGKSLDLYTDLYNSPTYLQDFCSGLKRLLELKKPGTYHLCGEDRINRYDFGVEIARTFGLDETLLTPKIGREDEPLRPVDLSLDGSKTNRLLDISMNNVGTALRLLRKNYRFP